MALVNELGDSTGESHPKIDWLNVVIWLLASIYYEGLLYNITLSYRKYRSKNIHDLYILWQYSVTELVTEYSLKSDREQVLYHSWQHYC